jgi:exopolyphosphatase / guanosine-5'-triphosphate,3'-diphosphate pyrophosphatase
LHVEFFEQKYEKKMIIASIDIGSNTVLLLISEINFQNLEVKSIKNYYQFPRISKGLLPGEPISLKKIEELIAILKEYKKICREFSVQKILPVATNALRITSNSTEIVSRIKNELDIEAKIIEGPEEAHLSFLGAVYPIEDGVNKTVVDIGGGSTEIIFGNNKNLQFKKSFQMGVVSLTEKFLTNKSKTIDNILMTERYVNKILNELSSKIPSEVETIAVAGTPTTLSCILQEIKIYDENCVENSILTYENVCSIIDEIYPLSEQEMSERYGQVVEGREDVLLAGCIILKIFMENVGLEKITVSNKGLRYGVVIDYMLRNNSINMTTDKNNAN